jgi:hypothetical protein
MDKGMKERAIGAACAGIGRHRAMSGQARRSRSERAKTAPTRPRAERILQFHRPCGAGFTIAVVLFRFLRWLRAGAWDRGGGDCEGDRRRTGPWRHRGADRKRGRAHGGSPCSRQGPDASRNLPRDARSVRRAEGSRMPMRAVAIGQCNRGAIAEVSGGSRRLDHRPRTRTPSNTVYELWGCSILYNRGTCHILAFIVA